MTEAARTSETSVGNHFTRQYIPEDNSENLPLCLTVHNPTVNFTFTTSAFSLLPLSLPLKLKGSISYFCHYVEAIFCRISNSNENYAL
jgi:hypothetical protein